MASFTNFWRIVSPASRKQLYTTLATDAYDPRTTDMSSMSTVKWYSQVLRGPGSRSASYKQYDLMDNDIDIARSLDIIAEEMSGKDDKTDLPFEIVYQKEDNQDISDSTSVTLRQAVRQWSELQDFRKRIFKIARTMIKYGDCFFRKSSDTKKWHYIHPSQVYGIEVDEWGNAISYHVKRGNTSNTPYAAKTEQLDIIPAPAIIHFTMSDDMGDSAPFGPSVLAPIYRVYRQLAMIEDAVIIYRIVRAPERRVFYLDTGNMPPQKVKQYLENVKNEIRQKRSPGIGGNGKEMVDGVLDPMSMQEDIFFPVSAGGSRGSRVETLPGGTEDFGTNLLKYFQDKIFRGLRIPTSYMQGSDGANTAQTNDGKVGIAYIEELRFANFVMRLQDRLEEIFDREFKIYLKVVGLKIDDEIFRIRLPDPANFALYRQAALDADMIGSFNNIEGVKYLSRRFILKRYLGLTDDEIQMNEVMLKEEREIGDNQSVPALRQIYDPAVYDARETVTVESSTPSAPAADEAPPEEEGGVEGFFGGDEAPPAEEPAAEEPAAEPEAPAAA